MLLQLNISNFTLIENLSISFDDGFNVFSGETGAGKSILIDAINYVLGGKFSKESIRTGQDKTYVEAVFTIENINTKTLLEQLGIEFEDLVIISRETFMSGRSIAKVNGKSLLLSNVKIIGQTLLDIHGQHENQSLLDSSNHIHYVDSFGHSKMQDLFDEYKSSFKRLKTIENRILEIEGQGKDKEKVIDFLEFQINEIESANLKANEDIELENEYSLLSNSEKINNVLSNCFNLLYEDKDGITSVYDSINLVIKDLRTIERHMEDIKKIANSLEESYYNIEQNIHDIRELKDNITFDDRRLEAINARIYQISMLKKKYGKSIDDIISYKVKLSNQFDELQNSAEMVNNLKAEKQVVIQKMKEISLKIHKIRVGISKELEQKIKSELNYIGLEKSIFEIKVDYGDEFYENGSDRVQFLISTNPGEPTRSLEKIVSGGELSRIMLALKTVFVNKDKIPTVIFDEIDTGISGRVAQSVGEKMYSVSNTHQVFCVTHLSQIACISDAHYLVSKQVENDKTFTIVKKLNENEKQHEIARMIGGSDVTKLTLDNSKEIIKLAQAKKHLLNKI